MWDGTKERKKIEPCRNKTEQDEQWAIYSYYIYIIAFELFIVVSTLIILELRNDFEWDNVCI